MALHARRSLIRCWFIRCATVRRFAAGVTTSFPKGLSKLHCRAWYPPEAMGQSLLQNGLFQRGKVTRDGHAAWAWRPYSIIIRLEWYFLKPVLTV